MQKNKVSVLMGIYNCADTLPEAIDSILNQTYQNWELILCDDGSTDGTKDVAKRYVSAHPDRIRLIENKKNMGLAASLNHCSKYATGSYFARMDGDDISISTRFEKQVEFLDSNPQYALVGTYMRAFDETGMRNTIPVKDIPEKYDLPKFNPFHHATVFIRRDAFNALGGYNVSVLTRRAEDVDLWFRFFRQGYRGYNIPEVLYLVRENQSTFRRRTFRHSFEASRLLARGIKLLQLPPQYYVYTLKPIVSQFTPRRIKRMFRDRMDKRNKEGNCK